MPEPFTIEQRMREYEHVGRWHGRGVEIADACKAAEEAVAAERERWQRVMWDCYMRLPVPPGDSIAWVDFNLEQHVIRVADEWEIRARQLDAERARAERAEAALAEVREQAVTHAEGLIRREHELAKAEAALAGVAHENERLRVVLAEMTRERDEARAERDGYLAQLASAALTKLGEGRAEGGGGG